MPIALRYEAGTLVLEGLKPPPAVGGLFAFDARVEVFRAPAYHYGFIAAELKDTLEVNTAPLFGNLEQTYTAPYDLFQHQTEALEAWQAANGRGIVELPTGSGKTTLGLLALSWAGKSALIVVPTRVLMHQWYAELKAAFPEQPIGLLGDGEHDLQNLTVATYESATIFAEKIGNRFGCLILDEVHHLPSDYYSTIVRFSIAPYRLGLSASLKGMEHRQHILDELVGPLIYRREPHQLKGNVLAPYRVAEWRVELSSEERVAYQAALEIRSQFLRRFGLNLSSLSGWQEFIKLSARSEEGRRAMKAHREATRIATAMPAKLRALEVILGRHAGQKMLIFTKENELAYAVSQTFLIPCITHQTHVRERQYILEQFASGAYSKLVSGNVLNEGINVPDAAVGVVLSGSGVEREFVQRLGRIIRRSGDKQAVLYEVVTAGTRDETTSRRRRGLIEEQPRDPASAKPLVKSLQQPLQPLSWDDLGGE